MWCPFTSAPLGGLCRNASSCSSFALFQVLSAAMGIYSSTSVIFLEASKENRPYSIARNQDKNYLTRDLTLEKHSSLWLTSSLLLHWEVYGTTGQLLRFFYDSSSLRGHNYSCVSLSHTERWRNLRFVTPEPQNEANLAPCTEGNASKVRSLCFFPLFTNRWWQRPPPKLPLDFHTYFFNSPHNIENGEGRCRHLLCNNHL